MAILNYTTEVSAQKSLHEIQVLLSRAKAIAILTELDGQGAVSAISFRVKGPHGVLSFRLPAKVEQVFAVLCREKIAPRYKTKQQASNVAWRIVKDWLEAQLALIQVQMVTLEQVFLPYVQDEQGVTLYERIRDEKFKGLALMPPMEGGEN